ncbi:biotin/lipoyl-binding protein [Nostoc sp.]|uniref:biotin/lipoyl-binding protein n=1 Tax=Nostoc sp. TaxID=1180 RepID=UPI002FF537BE
MKANATVRPTAEIRLVQAATEGTITSLKVKENQVVKKGDAIALIDNPNCKVKKLNTRQYLYPTRPIGHPPLSKGRVGEG